MRWRAPAPSTTWWSRTSRARCGRLCAGECLALSEGQKVATPRTRAYRHPDSVVVCGTPLYDEHAIVNPSLLVEVLSPSTADYDRGGKLVHYRTIESFTEYLLVSIQDRAIEHHGSKGQVACDGAP